MSRFLKRSLALAVSFAVALLASTPLAAMTRTPVSLTATSRARHREVKGPVTRKSSAHAAASRTSSPRAKSSAVRGATARTASTKRGTSARRKIQTTRSAALTARRGSRRTSLKPAVLTGTALQASGAKVAHASLITRRTGAMPAPLRGSLISLQRQNERAEAEGLERILDEDDLADRISRKLLVPVPASYALRVNEALPENHRYCRPWAAQFLSDIAHAHDAQFHQAIEVSSAVRTVAYQKHLMRVNGNAAPAEGDVVSPHLTGSTIDIAKSGLTRKEIGWMRSWLLPLQEAGKIDVEEEFRQSCFHITVYQSYSRSLPEGSVAKDGESSPASESTPDDTTGVKPKKS